MRLKSNKIRTYISLCLAFVFSLSLSLAQNQQVSIIKGQFSSEKNRKLIKAFAASKGDVLSINVKSLHKKRGVDIAIRQHPGNILVFDFQETMELSREIVVPADAIYKVSYGGSRLDFELNITNNTTKPSGPGRGEIVYVRVPDTVHVSGYVNSAIGESYKLTPYKERVLLNSLVVTEPILNRDFITGVDLMELYIPGDVKDEYREQKLLSYNLSLTVDAPSSYDAISGVVKAGMDAFIPELSPSKFVGKGKAKKMDPGNMYEVVKDAGKEKEKWEKTVQTVKLAQELGDSLRPGGSTNADKILETTGFLLDTDGMKEMALNEGLKAAGAPKEVMAIADKVMSIPSATDFLKDGFDKIASKVKGRAQLLVYEPRILKVSVTDIPETEFWVQSAMNYKVDNGGYWDLPGDPAAMKGNTKMVSWHIDDGIDRKFKFVPSTDYPGYYEIHSGIKGFAVDNLGGKIKNNGNNIVLWQRHGGESQVFKIKHLGNGRLHILNYAGKAVHMNNRKNDNGTEIRIWDEEDGEWMDFYLVDPTTKVAYVPKTKTMNIWGDVLLVNETAGVINKTIEVAQKTDALDPKLAYKEVKVQVREQDYVSDAKLLVEAKYLINEYTEVIKYKKETQPVSTKVFWTAFKVNYDYAIMFKDQVKDHYEVVSSSAYYSPTHSITEYQVKDDNAQSTRLMKYKTLTGEK